MLAQAGATLRAVEPSTTKPAVCRQSTKQKISAVLDSMKTVSPMSETLNSATKKVRNEKTAKTTDAADFDCSNLHFNV